MSERDARGPEEHERDEPYVDIHKLWIACGGRSSLRSLDRESTPPFTGENRIPRPLMGVWRGVVQRFAHDYVRLDIQTLFAQRGALAGPDR